MTEAEERQAVIAEARSWLGTAWHHRARVKGAGVDCALLGAEVYHACGLMPRIEPEHYPIDWAMHRDEGLFEAWVAKYARPVDRGEPGDFALYKYGRVFSHGAIIIDWPLIIHASRPAGMVTLDHGDQDWLTKASGEHALTFWSPWPRRAA